MFTYQINYNKYCLYNKLIVIRFINNSRIKQSSIQVKQIASIVIILNLKSVSCSILYLKKTKLITIYIIMSYFSLILKKIIIDFDIINSLKKTAKASV